MSVVNPTYVFLQNNGNTIVIPVFGTVRYHSINEHIWEVNTYNCVRCRAPCTKNVFCMKDPNGWCEFTPIFL